MQRVGPFAVLGLLIVSACGGGSSSSSNSTPSTASQQGSSSAATGPPTATVTVTGDADVAGDLKDVAVSCDNPGVDGSAITVTGSPATTSPAAEFFTIFISSGSVGLRVSSGSGTDFRVREFTGTGVSGFDAAKGVQLDSSLTAATSAGANKGPIGAVTSVKASVDCGNFDPGTSSLRLTGDTADGKVDGALTPVLVTCTTNQQGTFVVVRGVGNVGTTKALFFVTTQPDGSLQVFETSKLSGQHQYKAPAGTGMNRTDGGTIKGDATEQNTTPRHAFHLEGDSTCGKNAH